MSQLMIKTRSEVVVPIVRTDVGGGATGRQRVRGLRTHYSGRAEPESARHGDGGVGGGNHRRRRLGGCSHCRADEWAGGVRPAQSDLALHRGGGGQVLIRIATVQWS